MTALLAIFGKARQGRRIPAVDALRAALLLFLLLPAAPAGADTFAYIRAGTVNVDGISGSNPFNLGFNLGYELDSDFADMSVVGEINRSIDSGKIKRGGGDLEFESNGLYLMFRTTRSLFATFSVGAVQNRVIADGVSSRSTGIAFGGSVGIVIGRTRCQIEYTSLAGDADFFSIGLAF